MDAQDMTKVLGGRWHGSYGSARCPTHADREPSLSIRDGVDGEPVFNCFAGCDWRDIKDALRASGLLPELSDDSTPRRSRPSTVPKPRPVDAEQKQRTEVARTIWKSSRPATGKPVEDYLRGRGITIPVPASIRYHPACKHVDTGLHLPCLITAACNVDRHITGIQRVFLTHDGHRASVNKPKMALGPLRGSAVRLAPTTDRVWLTEGVEDALALVQMMGEPAWAVLGTSGFKTVKLPENVRQVIMAPDGDDAGQAISRETAIRLAGQGREVRVAKLPAGQDWCNVLDTYGERAGILEFDLGQYRPEAEALARREAIDE